MKKKKITYVLNISKILEIPPKARPSSTAYVGTVYGDHSFLNIVTRAAIKPPIKPIQIKEVLDDINVKQALAISINKEIPTLLNYPELYDRLIVLNGWS